MANCFCELIWPQATCEEPKVILSPSAILAKQGTSIKELVRSWKDKVSGSLHASCQNSRQLNVWCDLNKKELRINFGLLPTQKNIVLSGPKVVVTQAEVKVKQMLSSLYSVNVVFDKPGVKDFFRNQEQHYVNLVKMEFSCLIRLQRDDEQNGGSVENVQTKVNLKNGVVIEVCMGDLTSYQADVVVNASNETLKHIGGLASALLKAAGPQLQDECDVLIQKCGDLKPGCAVITGAWNLPCKQVIHAVGPRWTSANKENCIQLLKKAVKESLKLAEKFNHRSIAIPAISSGIFGFPIKELELDAHLGEDWNSLLVLTNFKGFCIWRENSEPGMCCMSKRKFYFSHPDKGWVLNFHAVFCEFC
uniref:Macro domain-containing protein n=1 Tax=Naja naja TaxID=35670 RepID=A0A8C6Y5K6_NAJNA